MSYPFASFGTFLFQRHEHILWATDVGWVRTPRYVIAGPHGSATDVATTLSLGSKNRTFEIILSEDRFRIFEGLLNSKAVFTDWGRPIPDSRMAFLSEVTPLEETISTVPGGVAIKKFRTKISLISA